MKKTVFTVNLPTLETRLIDGHPPPSMSGEEIIELIKRIELEDDLERYERVFEYQHVGREQ